ncbi:hypothetical protein BM1374166_01234 [Bartonella tribocorum]|nr:hypothetical protein BM1374166_01234 [Bartonella tribocorum]
MSALLLSKALFKESYIHFLILLIGFEGVKIVPPPQNVYYWLNLEVVLSIWVVFLRSIKY